MEKKNRMQDVYVLSAYETSAERFFETLLEHGTELLLDVRRKNTNQLCGFTKQRDLEYLTGKIAGAKYIHDLRFAPEPDLLEDYLKHRSGWDEFRAGYCAQMEKIDAVGLFGQEYGAYRSVCILGAGTVKRRSHSEILAEMINGQ
jgi:uncharacterized protein YeaO (DUF488 family)